MLKRTFDIIASLFLLLALSPLIAVLACFIRYQLGGPLFFRQDRSGKEGKPFAILKFRTMLDTVDPQGNLLSDAERLTPLGTFLRAVSLDELPELWNVLKGEMSLVGPRPFIAEYSSLYSPEQARRLNIHPGITGWAQINGRNGISWEEKFKLDLWYIDHQSFWLDIKILSLTALKVISRSGVNAEGDVTAPKFTGTGKQA